MRSARLCMRRRRDRQTTRSRETLWQPRRGRGSRYTMHAAISSRNSAISQSQIADPPVERPISTDRRSDTSATCAGDIPDRIRAVLRALSATSGSCLCMCELVCPPEGSWTYPRADRASTPRARLSRTKPMFATASCPACLASLASYLRPSPCVDRVTQPASQPAASEEACVS